MVSREEYANRLKKGQSHAERESNTIENVQERRKRLQSAKPQISRAEGSGVPLAEAHYYVS